MIPDASATGKKTEEEKAGLFSRFSKSESAAVTAIIAILLLGLVFTIVSVIRLEYIPEWKNNAEQDHMHDIWDSMIEVKVNIDLLSRLMESGNYSVNDFSATVPFGGGIVPVFEPSKSNGRLEVNTERCKMIVRPYNSTSQKMNSYPFECNGVSCYLGNMQYPDQIFRYENGAMILADGKSSIMKQSPVFTIDENETKKGNYTFAIRAVQLLGKPNSVSSNTIIPLRLTGLEAMPRYNSSKDDNTSINAFDLTIATKYPDAWFAYFNETAQKKGLDYGKDYTVKSDSNSVRFSFLPNGNKVLERLYISEAKISAEIIPLRYQNAMKLNQWYCFDTTSNTGVDLPLLMDYGFPVDFSIQNTDQILSKYSPSSNVFTCNLYNTSFESTFGFSGFTEFESKPGSVTILMIYHPKFDSPVYQDMSVSGIPIPALTGTNKKEWYLYKQTVPCTSISDPSKLVYNILIAPEKTKKEVDIDYLAVYLS